jgi:uncharacterized protein YkwD
VNFNWIDLLLVLVVAASAYNGWRRGFILSALDLFRWLGSLLAALLLYRPLFDLIGRFSDIDPIWRAPLAFLVIFIAAYAILAAVATRVLKKIDREMHLSRVNRAFGIVPGAISGIILAAIISTLLFAMPFTDGLSRSAQESKLASRLGSYTEEIESTLAVVFDPALRRTLNRLTTIEPGSRESVELPFRVDSAPPAPSLEAEMLDLVNSERAEQGLGPLEADPELTEVARKHSADMFARGYFSHIAPEGTDPFDRMHRDGVRFRVAGENLALAPTLEIAHTGLMNSPGHRANILRPQFGRVGIGILNGGRRGLMVTQKFRN